jgi:sarcosine oxidase
MRREYDYIVIGLGGIGSAAAYWLARRAGGDVLGLEQFELGHARGASQDHSRIIRLSYHTPGYVRLARQAYAAWDEVAGEAREQLIHKTGGLDLEPAGSALPLDDYIASLRTCAVAFELLDAAEIRRRWPQFRVGDDVRGLYQADGGIAAAAKCNAAHQWLARQRGAALLDNTPVTAIRPLAGEVEVVAGGTVYRCHKLVIAADAWTNGLLAHLGLRLPLAVTQEQVTYFATPRLAEYAPERFPVWIWLDEPSFYGFPAYGEDGVKVGQDVGGKEVTATTRGFDPDPAALGRVQAFLERHMPGALGPIIYTKTCLYTMPPDRDFIVDTLPGHPNIALAQGAAHGFKFASLLGKILSELAIDGASASDIEAFAFDRPILGPVKA